MKKTKKVIARLIGWALRGLDRGSATAEYALILALVVIILIGTLSTLGSTLNQKLQLIINQLAGAK